MIQSLEDKSKRELIEIIKIQTEQYSILIKELVAIEREEQRIEDYMNAESPSRRLRN